MDDARELAEALRAATRAQHRTVDSSAVMRPLLRPGLSVAQYTHALRALYRAMAACEAALRAAAPVWSAAGLDWHPRLRKTAWLADDLAALGEAPPPVSPAPLRLDTLPRCAGALYVLEGSTRGGQVLLTRLRAGAAPARALRYFAGYGADTARRWEGYWHELDAVARWDAAARAEACEAARETFGVFERCLIERRPDSRRRAGAA